MLLKRLQVWLRGLHLQNRQRARYRIELVRLVLFCRGCSLGSVDLIRGADFQSRHLLLALKAGDLIASPERWLSSGMESARRCRQRTRHTDCQASRGAGAEGGPPSCDWTFRLGTRR